MRLLFIAGDIGGARALAPVVRFANERQHEVIVIRHGAIVDELREHELIFADVAGVDITGQLLKLKLDWLVFATSVHDRTALSYAIEARNLGIKTATLLDHWSSFRERFETADNLLHWPDVYAVPDELALDMARIAGVPSHRLYVTGTPALAGRSPYPPREVAAQLEVLFISEPVASDQGDDPSNPKFRGYTEFEVLAGLCRALQPFATDITLRIQAHPREDVTTLQAIWQRERGDLRGSFVADADRRQSVERADRIIGMASILLYDCWLRGFAVLSVQPNLRVSALRYLENRHGLVFVDNFEALDLELRNFLSNGQRGGYGNERAIERERHANAAKSFLDLLSSRQI